MFLCFFGLNNVTWIGTVYNFLSLIALWFLIYFCIFVSCHVPFGSFDFYNVTWCLIRPVTSIIIFTFLFHCSFCSQTHPLSEESNIIVFKDCYLCTRHVLHNVQVKDALFLFSILSSWVFVWSFLMLLFANNHSSVHGFDQIEWRKISFCSGWGLILTSHPYSWHEQEIWTALATLNIRILLSIQDKNKNARIMDCMSIQGGGVTWFFLECWGFYA